MSGAEIPKSKENSADQRSIIQRLQALVEEARRQERIEQKVWRGFLWAIPLLIGGVCILAAIFTAQTQFESHADLLRQKITYFFAEKVTTQIVIVPRYAGPNPSTGYAEYVAYGNNALAAKAEALEKFKFVKNSAASGADWSVGILMHVRRDGSLSRVIVFAPSSIAAVNQAACRAVYQMFPIAPPPGGFTFSGEARLARWLRFHHSGAEIIDRFDVDTPPSKARFECNPADN